MIIFMKREFCFLLFIGILLTFLCACSQNKTSENDGTSIAGNAQETTMTIEAEEDLTNTEAQKSDGGIIQNQDDSQSTEYQIEDLKGSVRVPNTYYVFGEQIPFTDQMCEDIGIKRENMEMVLSLLQGQTLIVPNDEEYEESDHIYIKVKEKKYEDITLSELPQAEFDSLASLIVSGFGVTNYEVVEGNGLRFFVFTANQGLGNVCRFATILNGHMVYVYENLGDKNMTEQQRSDLEAIALSIQYGL